MRKLSVQINRDMRIQHSMTWVHIAIVPRRIELILFLFTPIIDSLRICQSLSLIGRTPQNLNLVIIILILLLLVTSLIYIRKHSRIWIDLSKTCISIVPILLLIVRLRWLRNHLMAIFNVSQFIAAQDAATVVVMVLIIVIIWYNTVAVLQRIVLI